MFSLSSRNLTTLWTMAPTTGGGRNGSLSAKPRMDFGVEIVCVLDYDEDGNQTVFFTLYYEE